jgi:hypothetical protein
MASVQILRLEEYFVATALVRRNLAALVARRNRRWARRDWLWLGHSAGVDMERDRDGPRHALRAWGE